MKSLSVTIQMEAVHPMVLIIMIYKVLLTFESVHGSLKYNHSKKS